MRYFLITVSLFFMCINAYAQEAIWTVRTGESIKEALGDSIIFRYPQFEPGRVYLRNGIFSDARLNLNLVNGEMEFINPSGDTMTVDYESAIRYIVIKSDTFYFDKLYVESVYTNAVAKLAKVVAIVPFDAQKVGGYDQPTATSSINAASYFFNGSQYSRITENKVLILHKKASYFIGDNYNHFLPASKKNIYKLFNKRKPAIDAFLKENKIVFVKEDDLVRLVEMIGKE